MQWALAVQDQVNEIADGGLTVDMSMKVQVLEGIVQILEKNPRSQGDAKTLKDSLLAMWVLVLKHLDEISVIQYKHCCYRVLLVLIQRSEFLLVNLGFDFTSQDVRMDGNQDSWRFINLYRQLLGDTFVYSSKLLLKNTLSSETQRFCAVVATHTFFVFPLLQASFVDICNWRYCQLKASKSLELFAELGIQRQEYREKCTNTAFMDSCPDIFHWGWLSRGSDLKTLLPDNNVWRLLLTSDGSLFVLFVQEFITFLSKIIAQSVQNSSLVSWGMIPGYVDIIELFIPFLYDTISWLNHVPSKEPVSPMMFEMTFSLADLVLNCASQSMVNPYIIRTIVPTAILAMQQYLSPHPVGMKRTLDTITKWIQYAAEPYIHVNHAHNPLSTKFENVLLYPSFIPMDKIIVLVNRWILSNDDSILMPALSFINYSIQHLAIKDKEQIVNALLKQFFTLFLHWSPQVRSIFHHILVYKLFSQNRRVLKLSSDAKLLNGASLDTPIDNLPQQNIESLFALLDTSIASKVNTFIYLLTSPPTTPPTFPEALCIFVDMSITEYYTCLITYYKACQALEHDLNRPLKNTELVKGPELSTLSNKQ
ncbi:hypothetical protein THRCLA_03369 [Thraustotheca clavata]|uniref:Uncharacterized protein n=1 Tax=Thraustotheca clavata TaxID=74557 RepID=A0A1W0A288_9STRA|nr:hypothetical protein THRCLA_03369 [Thraustotheca clavata]